MHIPSILPPWINPFWHKIETVGVLLCLSQVFKAESLFKRPSRVVAGAVGTVYDGLQVTGW